MERRNLLSLSYYKELDSVFLHLILLLWSSTDGPEFRTELVTVGHDRTHLRDWRDPESVELIFYFLLFCFDEVTQPHSSFIPYTRFVHLIMDRMSFLSHLQSTIIILLLLLVVEEVLVIVLILTLYTKTWGGQIFRS